MIRFSAHFASVCFCPNRLHSLPPPLPSRSRRNDRLSLHSRKSRPPRPLLIRVCPDFRSPSRELYSFEHREEAVGTLVDATWGYDENLRWQGQAIL